MSSPNVKKSEFIFYVDIKGPHRQYLLQVFQERGWKEYESTNDKDAESSDPTDCNWDLCWKTTESSLLHYQNQKPWQFNNHMLRGTLLTKKDNLCRYLKHMKNTFGSSLFRFSPDSYNMPLDFTQLVTEYNRDIDLGEKSIWICKPTDKCRGQGIFLTSRIDESISDSKLMVQRYIKNPMLIGGYKYDLRLLVLVPTFHPLTIYVYKEGVAKFCTEKFTLDNLDDQFTHLTNITINKLGANYWTNKDIIGIGSGWPFQRIRHHIRQDYGHDWILWQRISALISLTLISASRDIPNSINCFEMYGFDVLIDSCLRPWLMEVNKNPSLGHDTDIDVQKNQMLHSVFNLLGLPSIFDSKVTSEKERCSRDNGWNWGQNSVALEGDWVRTFPFAASTKTQSVVNDDDKFHSSIEQVREYLNCCEQVSSMYDEGLATNVSDDELDEKLRELFPSILKTWLPPH